MCSLLGVEVRIRTVLLANSILRYVGGNLLIGRLEIHAKQYQLSEPFHDSTVRNTIVPLWTAHM